MIHDVHLAEKVLRLRYWQQLINEELKKKAFQVPVHLALGHEAMAVAVDSMMTEGDQLALSHRNMAYNFVREGSWRPIYEEYKNSLEGAASGKLGSMNLANPQKGVMYTSSILGNNISVACGLALAKKTLRQENLVTVFTGDGGMEEGGFYEGLVFAKTHKLPLLIIVENNGQSMSSMIEDRRCPISIDKMCSAVGIPFKHFTGNRVFEYSILLKSIRKQIFEKNTPVCIEAQLKAFYQHAGPAPGWPGDPKNIDIKNGLVIEQNSYDPVFVLEKEMGAALFKKVAGKILSENV